jgi:hypothetical protein
MKTIILKKVEIGHLEVLQSMLLECIVKKELLCMSKIYNNDYFNNLLHADVCNKMWFNFRRKIENQSKKFGTVNLKIHEAVILLQCCNDFIDNQLPFEKNLVRKYHEEIHKQVINL